MHLWREGERNLLKRNTSCSENGLSLGENGLPELSLMEFS